VLRAEDLSLQSILPFSETPPADVALSPDGETLYLLGNGWLTALSTAELRGLGLAPVSPLPTAWFVGEPSEQTVQPRLHPSAQMEADGVAFVQLVTGMENVLETYTTTDGGRSWILVPSLLQPDRVGATFLSLSPDFRTDKTLTARAGSTLLRSTDRGGTWQMWQPRIAFTSDRDGNREIYTVDPAGRDVQQLTDTPAAEENPAWSPAWTRLAFQSNREGNWDIFSMRVDCDPLGPDAATRCDLRQLTDHAADDMLPAWSPDGRAIAFVSTRDGNPEIYVMASGGGNPRRLTFHPTGDWRPAWLPDSQHLVFVSDRSGNNDIYQLTVPALDGPPLASEPELTPVIVGPADDRDPAVGAGLVKKLLFLSDRDGVMRTYVAEGTAQPRPFAQTDRPEGHPATLPGELYTILVSAERDGRVDIYRAGLSGYTALAPSPGFDGQPAGEATGWVPDTAASLAWLQAQAR
jgi:dipeptidyl aminopeptidase/acylaminoacyl peptidase